MRKRRAIVLDDDPTVLNILKMFFTIRGYEVIALPEPVRCPVYDENAPCQNVHPCADIIVTDFRMPKMTGLAMLQAQVNKGCKLTVRNKAIISGYIDASSRTVINRLGCAYFEKPFLFQELEPWIAACEERMDLSRPLGMKRKELRTECCPQLSCDLRINGEICSGTALNRSESGLCVKVRHPLSVQQMVTVVTSLSLISYQAIVRWISDLGDGTYLVGLSCC